ncbi:hypothetical protein HUJ05_002388 [Dendroctonus ponderosae]|nr:hypothetical protein HUJ05_002388 [Dendroctonus ponderosae]
MCNRDETAILWMGPPMGFLGPIRPPDYYKNRRNFDNIISSFKLINCSFTTMAFKFVILALTLAYAHAGQLLAQPAVQYSSAPAVSSSYFQQASAPVAYAKTYAAPTLTGKSAVPVTPAYANHYLLTPTTAQPVAYQAQPLAYQTGPVAVHSPSVGLTQQSVTRSLGGGQSLSTYSKAVDSAYSTVRKYDTRFTNDALAYAPAQLSYSAPLVTKAAYAAPAQVVSYGAPVETRAYAAPSPVVSYGAPLVTKTYGAPAQVVSYGAPLVSKSYAPAPQVVSYGAPLVTKSYAAAPQVVSYGAPLVAKSYAAPAPVVSYGAPAQLIAKAPVAAYGAPVVTKSAAISYSPAEAVAHTTFQGYGIEYHY